jgi:hypothetical protein
MTERPARSQRYGFVGLLAPESVWHRNVLHYFVECLIALCSVKASASFAINWDKCDDPVSVLVFVPLCSGLKCSLDNLSMRRNGQVTFDAKKTGAGMTRILFGGC